MKRRRLIAAVSAIVLAGLTLSSCNQNGAKRGRIYTVYYAEEAPISPFENMAYYEKNAPAEASVMVNGKVYSGKYRGTYVRYTRAPYMIYDYKGDGFTFELDVCDDKRIFFELDAPKVESCAFDKAASRKAADEIANDYILPDEYQVRLEEWEGIPGSHNHSYRYYREVSGMETSDYIRIQFDCNGELQALECGQLGAFKNVKSVDIDENKVIKALEARYKERSTKYNEQLTEYEILSSAWYLGKTEANQCYLSIHVSTSWKRREDTLEKDIQTIRWLS